MAAQASIKWVYDSPYRGGTKRWSTTFHVSGGNWQDQAHFDTFADNQKPYINNLIPTVSTCVEAVGYDPGSAVPVFTKAYGTAGGQAIGSSWLAPLESCILLRFTTDQRSTKNHPIYLFNYIHNVYSNGATQQDKADTGLVSTWTSRCGTFITGLSDGSLTRKRVGPRGAVAQTGAAETYFHHRDFPA